MKCPACGHEAPDLEFEYAGAQDLRLLYEGDIWLQLFICPGCRSSIRGFYTQGSDRNGPRVENPKYIE